MKRVIAILALFGVVFGLSACTHDTDDIVYTPIIVTVDNRPINCIAMIDHYNGESAFTCDWYGYKEDGAD